MPINDDERDDEPEPPELKRAHELHEAYRAGFGEWAPKFGVPYTTDDGELEGIQEALKTGVPIRENIPPGCDA